MNQVCFSLDESLSNMSIPFIIMLTQAIIMLLKEYYPALKRLYLLSLIWLMSVIFFMLISRLDNMPLLPAFLKGNFVAYVQVFGHSMIKAFKNRN